MQECRNAGMGKLFLGESQVTVNHYIVLVGREGIEPSTY